MAHTPYPDAKPSVRSFVADGGRRQYTIGIHLCFSAGDCLAHSRHGRDFGGRLPGSFTVGDTQELRRLLIRAEREPDFLRLLRSRSAELSDIIEPSREQRAWKNLLGELKGSGHVSKAFEKR